MKIGLLCGKANNLRFTSHIDMWVGVDKGAITLLEHNIIPICAIGDFDSITSQQFAYVEQQVPHIVRLNPHKDLTDTEAALNYCLTKLTQEYTIDTIEIYGATGGRLDHFLANLNILANVEAKRQNISLSLIDAQNKLTILPSGHYKIDQEHYNYLSFIPRNEGVQITLNNVKYPLTDKRLNLSDSLTVSNEWLEGPAEVSIDNGQMIMIKSKDE